MVGDPDLIYLDEPTTGFDPEARRRSWELIDGMRDEGKTILLTTHYMEEAQRLADQVGVLAAGRLVVTGPPEELAGSSPAEAEVAFHLPAGVGAGELPLPHKAELARSNGSTSSSTRRPRPATSRRCSAGPRSAGSSSTASRFAARRSRTRISS